MAKEEKLLKERIPALHHNGMKSACILKNYLEYKMGMKESSVQKWSEAKDNMLDFIR